MSGNVDEFELDRKRSSNRCLSFEAGIITGYFSCGARRRGRWFGPRNSKNAQFERCTAVAAVRGALSVPFLDQDPDSGASEARLGGDCSASARYVKICIDTDWFDRFFFYRFCYFVYYCCWWVWGS
jgi:hypothetical protein